MKCATIIICAALALPALPALAAATERDVVYFQLGEDGDLQNREPPPALLANLAARGQLQLTQTAVGRLAWTDVWRHDQPLLALVRSRLGARIELLALVIDDGTVRAAARRPATTAFDGRLDWGLPGAGEGEENAWRELAADIHWAETLTAAPMDLAPVAVTDTLLSAKKRQLFAATVEALAAAAIGLDGQPLRLADDGAIKISLARQATMLSLKIVATTTREMPTFEQGDLFPYLQAGWRGASSWGAAVGAVRVLDPAWRPLTLLPLGDGPLLLQITDKEFLAYSVADGTPQAAPKAAPAVPAPPPGVLADELLADYDWGRDLIMPTTTFGKHVVALSSTRVAQLLDDQGKVVAEQVFPDRLHAALALDEGELVIVDVAGGIWQWLPGQAPRLHLALGVRPHGPMLHAPQLFNLWPNPIAADEFSLEGSGSGRFLLVASETGSVLHLPYPLVTP